MKQFLTIFMTYLTIWYMIDSLFDIFKIGCMKRLSPFLASLVVLITIKVIVNLGK